MRRPPYSEDIRGWVVGEVEAGGSRRAAARRFKVSASSAIRWVDFHNETGKVGPGPRKRKSRSPLEPHAAWLLELVGKEPDLTLAEIEARLLSELKVSTTDSSIDRFFKRHKISFKKGDYPLHARNTADGNPYAIGQFELFFRLFFPAEGKICASRQGVSCHRAQEL
jgi:transposase